MSESGVNQSESGVNQSGVQEKTCLPAEWLSSKDVVSCDEPGDAEPLYLLWCSGYIHQ